MAAPDLDAHDRLFGILKEYNNGGASSDTDSLFGDNDDVESGMHDDKGQPMRLTQAQDQQEEEEEEDEVLVPFAPVPPPHETKEGTPVAAAAAKAAAKPKKKRASASKLQEGEITKRAAEEMLRAAEVPLRRLRDLKPTGGKRGAAVPYSLLEVQQLIATLPKKARRSTTTTAAAGAAEGPPTKKRRLAAAAASSEDVRPVLKEEDEIEAMADAVVKHLLLQPDQADLMQTICDGLCEYVKTNATTNDLVKMGHALCALGLNTTVCVPLDGAIAVTPTSLEDLKGVMGRVIADIEMGVYTAAPENYRSADGGTPEFIQAAVYLAVLTGHIALPEKASGKFTLFA